MSRSIKFRAYIKPLKRYAEKYETILYHHQCNMEPSWTVNISPEEYYGDEEVVIEPFTGLLDRNGKEIYEGDIVKGRWWRTKNARLDTDGEIKFNDGWFYIKDDPDGQDRLGVPIHNCYNLEIIGNIHENPELLGGEDE